MELARKPGSRETRESRPSESPSPKSFAARVARQRAAWAEYAAEAYPEGFTAEGMAAAEREWQSAQE